MNLLARARGLQERIRPELYLASRGRPGYVRSVEAGINPRPGREKSSWSEHRDRTGQQSFILPPASGRGVSTLPSLLSWNLEP